MRIARLLAPALAFWLSGLACLLVCASMCTREATAAAAPSQGHACCARSAQIEAEESCAAGGDSVARAVMRGEPSLEGCCFLTARASALAPLPHGFNLQLAPAAARELPLAGAAAPAAPATAASLPVLNRGDTHLRCCVFLI